MTPSLVTPGMNVSSAAECEAGEGTIEVDGRIIATAIGAFSIEDGIGTVTAAKPIVTPEVGDTVLCEIVKLNEKNGEAQVICIEGKPGSVLPEHLYGQFHVTNIVDRYMHQTADAVRRRAPRRLFVGAGRRCLAAAARRDHVVERHVQVHREADSQGRLPSGQTATRRRLGRRY